MEVKKHSNSKYEYIFNNGSSTIGNILQKELLKNENIVFAGYNCPHPLELKMFLVIETKNNKNPKEILIESINKLIDTLNMLELKFTDPL